ncbi:C-terminal novel E3 ligase, LRR-interacting [Pseudomonas gessardii]|uniref:NEL-type E3 ubiquitin ligase domain-containing protein n=1 Tax=Pseudomonas gessardii TaxID=78544 RepID=UPI00088F8313|nr:NEL-type E3 ubiquitin ligase domain-containing protein [Pseudomonas gessardii]MRU53190.1 hypothetical protein [Pseudomonas gessardii]ONH38827.1 hypothetical protein BLL38_22550 [Pseudomonas gessardii]SDQ73854.1 C-terminal novel E3 ligase, LRR-interacting [Pseudomonas gessardii]
MTQIANLSQALEPVSPDELMKALLSITGDLDKAQVLHDTLPAWLVKADSQALQAIEQAYADSEVSRGKLQQRLSRLNPLDKFCAEQLEAFLVAKGHIDLDIENDTLELPKRSFSSVNPDLGGMLIETITLEKHSLLQAAMQNFSQARAEPGGIPINAVVRIGAKRRIARDITAQAFIGYCRELNLGEAYQAHVREVFNPGDLEHGLNPVVREVGQSRCADMLIDLQVAHAKGDIDQPTHALLLELVRADMPARDILQSWFNNQPLTWQGLNIGGACLWGVLVFSSAASEGFSSGPIVVYMPNEPVRPWYRYASLEQFKLYLTLKLHVSTYRTFFMGYLDESERFGFFERFDKHNILVRVEPLPVTDNFSLFFFNACVGKIQLDTRVLAVPNAQADDDARQQRIQDYLDAGLTVLNVAAFVVPVLGQLMMGVAVGQLLAEVFDGVDDWMHQDKLGALRHLTNIAENLAAMALFAAGTKVVGRLWRTTPPPAGFYERLEAVRMPDKTTRLWRNRTQPYRHTVSLEGTVASPRGVYQAGGQSYVKVDGSIYSIVFDSRTGRWRARHPQRTSAYQPPMTHNYQGGWQFSFEHPQEWQDPDYILVRLDPSLSSFAAGHLRDIAAITDTALPRLQQLAKQNLPLPERLRECALRFRQNQDVRDLIWQMEHQAPLDASTTRVQMLALPLMDGWPQGRFFELLDEEGDLLERHPDTAPFDYEDLSIHITTRQLRSGQVMSTLLAALDPEETARLLGGNFQPEEAQEVLARRLTASLKDNHRAVFERLRADADFIDQTDHGLLKQRYRRLPIRVAWEVMTQASTAERWRLRHSGRVPLRIAQRARETLGTLDEDEALTGLYLPELASDATRRMAIGLLRQVPGWPEDVWVQLRREGLSATVLGQVGNAGAATTRTVVQSAAGFRAYDGQGAPLGAMADGPQGFYEALLNCLSGDQLDDLHLQGSGRASQLRNTLIGKAEDERSRVARYLWPERAVPEEPAVSCVQGMPVELQRQPAGLLRKVRKLYPLFDDQRISTFVQDLGSDLLSRAKAIRVLEQQYEALRQALKVWARGKVAPVHSDVAVWDYRLARHQAAQAIERSWQYASLMPDEYQQKVPSLSLDDMAVGALPTLPPDVQFGHIRQLSLRNMGLNDDVGYFLKHFKGLNTLELRDNRVTRLPEVLQQMKQLRRLYLANNQMQLTEYTRTKLGDLKGLTVLDLSNNPLVDPPFIGKMFELRNLVLRNCRLKNLPSGFMRIPYLEQLDLRENDIATLPDWLFTAPRRRAEVINLRHNPLDAPSRLLLHNYRDTIGVGMGFVEDDIARLNEQAARELWLGDERVAHYAEKAQTWRGLKDEPGSDGLFKLLAGLGGAADTTHVQEDMGRRVWRVLDAAAMDTRLREEIFERAATPLNCDDAAAVSFSNLEVLVEIHEASQRVAGGLVTAKPLLRLARGLFRLDRLELMARRHSAEHPALDPLEVSLAYRTGLVERFHLPGQPRHMRYASLGGVTEHMLEVAEAQLKEAELSPLLLKYMVKLPFWNSYLRRIHGGSFDTLNQPFGERMEAVWAQRETLGDADYRNQMEQIQDEQKKAELTEFERLTKEALKFDEQVACELPPAG